ncbi:unnamed protein product [Lampetra fluviatilis]
MTFTAPAEVHQKRMSRPRPAPRSTAEVGGGAMKRGEVDAIILAEPSLFLATAPSSSTTLGCQDTSQQDAALKLTAS